MRAVWLEQIGAAPQVVDRPDPEVRESGVVVKVLAVRVPSYTRGVFDGSLNYDVPTPLVPGGTCIGEVVETGQAVFDVKPGDLVLCNSLLSSGDADGASDDILIGLTGTRTPRSARMQALWHDGSFAEMASYPSACVLPLPGAVLMRREKLPFLAALAIADNAFDRAGFASGQSVLVNGATGQLGSAAVLMALTRGASIVVALGRDNDRLDRLCALSPRVTAVLATSEPDVIRHSSVQRTDGGPDVVIDLLGQTPTPDLTLTAIGTLRRRGTAVLVGGVRHSLPLPYDRIMRLELTIRGSFMFSREGALRIWRLVQGGAIDLKAVKAYPYALDDIDAAMTMATSAGGLDCVTLLPNG